METVFVENTLPEAPDQVEKDKSGGSGVVRESNAGNLPQSREAGNEEKSTSEEISRPVCYGLNFFPPKFIPLSPHPQSLRIWLDL